MVTKWTVSVNRTTGKLLTVCARKWNVMDGAMPYGSGLQTTKKSVEEAVKVILSLVSTEVLKVNFMYLFSSST